MKCKAWTRCSITRPDDGKSLEITELSIQALQPHCCSRILCLPSTCSGAHPSPSSQAHITAEAATSAAPHFASDQQKHLAPTTRAAAPRYAAPRTQPVWGNPRPAGLRKDLLTGRRQQMRQLDVCLLPGTTGKGDDNHGLKSEGPTATHKLAHTNLEGARCS